MPPASFPLPPSLQVFIYRTPTHPSRFGSLTTSRKPSLAAHSHRVVCVLAVPGAYLHERAICAMSLLD